MMTVVQLQQEHHEAKTDKATGCCAFRQPICAAEPHEEGTGNSNELRWAADGQNVPARRLRMFEPSICLQDVCPETLSPQTLLFVLEHV